MSETEHYRALLEVSKAILAHKDLTALFHQLSRSLPSLLKLGFVDLALHEPARQVMRAYTIATPEDAPEQILFHDCAHVLSDYGTAPEEEVQVACFSRFRKREETVWYRKIVI